MILDINMINQSVGKRGAHAYAFRDMLDAGIQLMFSSDCPVADPSPLVGIHAAVTRQRADRTPKDGWYPDQAVAVDEAVRAYICTPAVAGGAGDTLGSLASGKQADIIVLDRDIYSIPPQEIIETAVDMTIFNGRVVYRSESF
jgi:predicted amidohydrolase YtcJ